MIIWGLIGIGVEGSKGIEFGGWGGPGDAIGRCDGVTGKVGCSIGVSGCVVYDG